MKTTLRADFGERVRRLREGAGLSQEELAHAAGIDRSYMSDIERGTTNVTLETMARIATGLRTTLAALVTGLR